MFPQILDQVLINLVIKAHDHTFLLCQLEKDMEKEKVKNEELKVRKHELDDRK